MMNNNSLSNLSSKELGNKNATGKKLVGSIHAGMTANQERKDEETFQKCWDNYFAHQEEIISSIESADKFISEISALNLMNNVVKSKSCFLIALCYYLTQRYTESKNYIEQALKLYDNPEYHLFENLIFNKKVDKDVHYIVSSSIKILNNLQVSLLDKSYYESELRDSFQEETKQYKQAAVKEAKSYFFKRSLICIPLFLYIYYKHSIYVAPEGWFTFSWNPVYVILKLVIIVYYVPKVFSFISILSRSLKDWEERMRNEYVNQ